MISCDQALELISESLDGPLSPEDRAALDEHLAGCADCRALLADFQEMERTLPTLNAPVPPDFTQSVMDRVREEKVVDLSAVRAARRPWKQWAATAAVFAVVLLGVGTLGLDQLAVRFGSGTSTASAPENSAALSGGAGNADAALPESDAATGAAEPAATQPPEKSAPTSGDTAVSDGDTPVSNDGGDQGSSTAPSAGASSTAPSSGGGSNAFAGSGAPADDSESDPNTAVQSTQPPRSTPQQSRDNPNTLDTAPAGIPYQTANETPDTLTADEAYQRVFEELGETYPDADPESGVLATEEDSALVLEDTGLSDNKAYYTFRLDRTFSDSTRTETVNFYALSLDGSELLTCRDESLLKGLTPGDAGWEEAKAAYDQARQDYFDTIHN